MYNLIKTHNYSEPTLSCCISSWSYCCTLIPSRLYYVTIVKLLRFWCPNLLYISKILRVEYYYSDLYTHRFILPSTLIQRDHTCIASHILSFSDGMCNNIPPQWLELIFVKYYNVYFVNIKICCNLFFISLSDESAPPKLLDCFLLFYCTINT